MHLANYLALLSIFVFIILLLINKKRIRTYLLYVAFSFPIMDISITPASFGSLSVFDGISY
ncbi:MAG: hypothetical protein ACSLE0_07595, partial [Chitinophagaceae bacterium]